MLQSDNVGIEIGELQIELRALQAEPPAEDATEEVRDKHDTDVKDGLKKLDELQRAKTTALKAEDLIAERAARLASVEQRVGAVGAGDMPNIPPEFREIMAIEARCKLDGFFDGIHENVETVGAEREMRQALGVNQKGVIPWPMLIDPLRLQEIRKAQRAALSEGAKVRAIVGKQYADLIGEGNDIFLRAAFGSGSTVMSMQDPIIQDVFAGSTAAFLMTRFSSAPVGDALELVLTSTGAGVTADRTARAATGSLAARTLTPKPVRAVYDINKTDLQRFRGLEASLRADLPRAINDVVDKNVLVGSDFSGSILARTTDPGNPTATVTFASGIASLSAAVDGRYALNRKQVKLVVNPNTYGVMGGLIAGNTAVSLLDYYAMNFGGVMTTANMPATASMIAKAIACKTGPGVQYNGIAKMWGGGIQVIRDEYTKAAEHQLLITANLSADYDVVRTAGYLQIEFKTS